MVLATFHALPRLLTSNIGPVSASAGTIAPTMIRIVPVSIQITVRDAPILGSIFQLRDYSSVCNRPDRGDGTEPGWPHIQRAPLPSTLKAFQQASMTGCRQLLRRSCWIRTITPISRLPTSTVSKNHTLPAADRPFRPTDVSHRYCRRSRS
jgi:hypothetical protein